MEDGYAYIKCSLPSCRNTTEFMSLRAIDNKTDNLQLRITGYFCPDCFPEMSCIADALYRADTAMVQCSILERAFEAAKAQGDEDLALKLNATFQRLAGDTLAVLQEWHS